MLPVITAPLNFHRLNLGVLPVCTSGCVDTGAGSWLSAAATDEARGVTRDSCIWDMLICSKLSGAGEGTFSNVPDVDRKSVADICVAGWGLMLATGWTTGEGWSIGFSTDAPGQRNGKFTEKNTLYKHQCHSKTAKELHTHLPRWSTTNANITTNVNKAQCQG